MEDLRKSDCCLEGTTRQRSSTRGSQENKERNKERVKRETLENRKIEELEREDKEAVCEDLKKIRKETRRG